MANRHIYNKVETLRGNASQHLSFAIFYLFLLSKFYWMFFLLKFPPPPLKSNNILRLSILRDTVWPQLCSVPYYLCLITKVLRSV